MQGRGDVITALLEEWASWRLCYELWQGTGDSPLVRFLSPGGGSVFGSRVLWSGMIGGQLSRLDRALVLELGFPRVLLLLALYGLPGHEKDKAQRLRLSYRTLARVRDRGRGVVREYLGNSNAHVLTFADKTA